MIDPSTAHKRAQNSNVDPDDDQLRLNPGAPQRKPRSAGKFCLWLLAFVIVLLGGMALYMFLSSSFDEMRHPHKKLYHDEVEAEVKDWSQVVRPMITKESKFDVIASVWIRDEDGKDAFIGIDGEERPERLIFTDTVFRDVDVKSKVAFTNVTLRVPTNYFKRVNLSNYDLRASFVLAQSRQNRSPEPWLEFANHYNSWKGQWLKTPRVRKLDLKPTLENQIYDSFGITLPLIEFHNIASKRSNNIHWMPEYPKSKNRNTFQLEFSGLEPPLAYHPYIVTRTHLRIVKQNDLFKKSSYDRAQWGLASRMCANKAGEPIMNPQWYHCRRLYLNTGVFETTVQLQIPSEEDPETKNDTKWRFEWLYAPFLSAMPGAAGPKDLTPLPVDRERFNQWQSFESVQKLTPDIDEEYVNVTWRISFSSHTPGNINWSDAVTEGNISTDKVYNMTEPDNKLEKIQHTHDTTVGLLIGHRIDEDAHPRRMYALDFTSTAINILCWFLTFHYWYTRTNTTGISRLGTGFLILWHFIDTMTGMLAFAFDPEIRKQTWLSLLGVTYIFHLTTPIVMLITVLRLEFGWSTKKKRSGRDDEREKKKWIPTVSIAKATHLERTSERIEARVSKKAKLLLFSTLLAAVHFFATPESYILSPRIPMPYESHPLEPFSPYIPTILKYVKSFSGSSRITGAVLQFIMNFYSQTYAGNYKITTLLRLVMNVLLLLDIWPRVVGTTLRTHGVGVREGIGLVIAVVDFIQAVKYQNVKGSDAEDSG